MVPALGTLTTAIANSAIIWGAAKSGKAAPKQHDPMWLEVRRLGVERKFEKDHLKRKQLSIALYEARQLMRRKQTDLNFKKADQVRHHACKGHRRRHPLRSWKELGVDGTTKIGGRP